MNRLIGHVPDLDRDPTPGDPERARKPAKFLHDLALRTSRGAARTFGPSSLSTSDSDPVGLSLYSSA
ncbi:hypothetical protein PV661_20175 [Streptomyces sp. MD20-1-1]|uniref:hypothetical protein n=1 Tax=Streptomyces sp. MD20-1-1 TaxID=3028668 RepID=UPI0029B45A5B|nr:hypothetical protein [Streptomyces sp. MD20-1-1]